MSSSPGLLTAISMILTILYRHVTLESHGIMTIPLIIVQPANRQAKSPLTSE